MLFFITIMRCQNLISHNLKFVEKPITANTKFKNVNIHWNHTNIKICHITQFRKSDIDMLLYHHSMLCYNKQQYIVYPYYQNIVNVLYTSNMSKCGCWKYMVTSSINLCFIYFVVWVKAINEFLPRITVLVYFV